jgi:large subunit ribosomal protein L22
MKTIKNRVVAKARLMKSRISPKKLGPVVDLIRGKTLKDAKITLKFDATKAAKTLLKVLMSAEANAINNSKIPKENIVIDEIWVGQGRVFKSGQFVGRGNFRPILKRTSNIYVNLAERETK